MHVVFTPSFHRTSLGDVGETGKDGATGINGTDGNPGETGKHLAHQNTPFIRFDLKVLVNSLQLDPEHSNTHTHTPV